MRGPRATQGAGSNHKKRRRFQGRWRRLGPRSPRQRRGDGPGDHAIGRSRGGLTCKSHAIVDGQGRPLVIAVTPGHAGDSPQLVRMLAELSVDRLGPGRPRTTPQAWRADNAYSSRAHRALVRRRGITVVIPEPDHQKRNRARRGSRGGRPAHFDAKDYKARNVVERGSTRSRTGVGWPRATASTPWSSAAV